MVYVIFAAVMCSIQAATQGGSAYQLMLFSIILTYGSTYFVPVLGRLFRLTLTSVCAVERARVRPMAHVHQLHPIYAPVANLYQHSPDVRPICPHSCQKLMAPPWLAMHSLTSTT